MFQPYIQGKCDSCGEMAVLLPCKGDVVEFWQCRLRLCGECAPYCPDCDAAHP